VNLRRLTIATVILAGFGMAASSPAEVHLDPWLNAPVWRPTVREMSAVGRPAPWVDVFLLGNPDHAALGRLGVQTRVHAGSVLTARVPRGAFEALSHVRGLEAIMLVRPMQLFLDASVDSVHARQLRTLGPDSAWIGHTGQGVILGIVDSGVDVTHDDFRNPDGTTRISAYWDQNDSTGTPPSFGYGSEWTASQLLSIPRAWDTIGHGTHVAGIAAGDGSASAVDSLRFRFVGLAPEAEIIAVAVNLTKDTNILDAVNYVFDRAENESKPAVVNLSLGNQFGPHDGRTPLEIGIDALVGPGRLVVAAAGNDGADRIHAALHVSAGGRDSASVFVGPYAPGSGLLFFSVDAFYDASKSFDVTVVTPDGHRFGPFANGQGTPDTLTGQGTLFLDHAPYPPEPTQIEIAGLISNVDPDTTDGQNAVAPVTGEWRLVFTDQGGSGGVVNLWLPLASIRDVGGNPPYWLTGYVPGYEIAAPGTGGGVLTVGAWNTKPCWPDSLGQTRCTTVTPVELTEAGRIAFFSSRGPTRDGRDKPEIVAPGFVIASARSAQILPEYAQLYRFDRTLQADREHFVYLGTSMAAPHVAGALALALEENPALDPAGARNTLKNTVAHDEHAPPPWSPAAGYGKLDVAALVAGFVPVSPGVLQVTTNASGRPHLEWQGHDEAAFRLESRQNGSPWQERARFPGPGEHAWDESEPSSYWDYRLWATTRSGQSELWGEATWHEGGTIRVGVPFPNPFNTSCAVSLSGAASAGHLELRIYDAAGHAIRRISGRSGDATLRWDGRDEVGRTMPAGVYWIEARVGPFRRSARVVRLP
jgi:subtilisin family serine protease